jgi:hypothetical protein
MKPNLGHLIENVRQLAPLEQIEVWASFEDERLADFLEIEPLNSTVGGILILPSGEDLDYPGHEGDDEVTDGGVQRYGMHFLAWYQPFHPFAYGKSKRWGIFVRASSVEFLARKFRHDGALPGESLALATRLLYMHEAGHFLHEYIAASAEVITSSPIYMQDVINVRKSPHGYSLVAEGLCNHIALSSIKGVSLRSIKSWMKTQPHGYSDWKRHTLSLRPESWAELFRDFRMQHPLSSLKSRTLEQPCQVFEPTAARNRDLLPDVPFYLVPDGHGPGGSVAGAWTDSVTPVETRRFRKDLESTGDKRAMLKAWEKTKQQMAEGHLNGAIHFEKLRRIMPPTYSVRVEGFGIQGARAALVKDSERWYAVAVDRDHDSLYRRVQVMNLVDLDLP